MGEPKLIPPVKGGWGHRPSKGPLRKWAGTVVDTDTVTRHVAYLHGQTRWEVQCKLCKALRGVDKRQLEAAVAGKRKLPPCECQAVTFSAEAVRDQFRMTPDQLKVVIAVLAYEVAYGYGPLRLELEVHMKRSPEAGLLVKKGWLESKGVPGRLTGTPMAWKQLGQTKPKREAL